MNPIAMLFGFGLLAVSVFFVASPFRSPSVKKESTGGGIPQPGSGKLSPEKQRQAVLLALRDLDFDYQASKVADEDYHSLHASLLNEAAQLLQGGEQQKDEVIEALIQSRRQARSASPLEQSALKDKVNGAAEKRCQRCQARLPEGAKFCAKCGSPVEEIICPKCKYSLQSGDRFCPSCGTGTAIPSEKQCNQTAELPEGD